MGGGEKKVESFINLVNDGSSRSDELDGSIWLL